MQSFYGSKLNTVLLLILIVLMIFALRFMYQNQGEYVLSLRKGAVENKEQVKVEPLVSESDKNLYKTSPSNLVTSDEDGVHDAIIRSLESGVQGKIYLSVDYVEVYGGEAGMKAAKEDGVCNSYEECGTFIVRYIRNNNPQLRSFEIDTNAKFNFDNEHYLVEDFKAELIKFNSKFQNCLSNFTVKDNKITNLYCSSAG